jgi:hypothetical protein
LRFFDSAYEKQEEQDRPGEAATISGIGYVPVHEGLAAKVLAMFSSEGMLTPIVTPNGCTLSPVASSASAVALSVRLSGSGQAMSGELAQAEYWSVADPTFAHSYPELHHYTNFAGISGIFESQTIWATQFCYLNDSSEVSLLRDPLTVALKRRFLRALVDRQRGSLRLQMFLRKHGGAPRVAEGDADRLVQILHENIFGGGLAVPFIASFCSHVNDQSYEKENGLLSQWRGYGKDGGFCIVFDTAAFVTILEAEFNAYNWIRLRIAPVRYAYDDIEVDTLFPELVERCDAFFIGPLENKHPLVDQAGLASFFMSACPLFKHRGFHEEREVRIVAIPGARDVLRSNPEYDLSERWKTIHVRGDANIPYLRLNDHLNKGALPIKRVIVGPSQAQTNNLERARGIVGDIPVLPSATPFRG